MNCLYFACMRCKDFIDAGYRWAWHTLEKPGIVQPGHPVDVDAVLGAAAYWVADGDWISRDIHPFVRTFLETHRTHRIQFGDQESFQSPNDLDDEFEWLEVGPGGEPAREPGLTVREGPRCWIEKLGFSSWDQVVARVEQGFEPTFWFDARSREAARQVFQRLRNR